MRSTARWLSMLVVCVAAACSQSPTATADGPGTSIPSAGSTAPSSVRALPPGFQEYTDASGLQLAHPAGWTVEPAVAGPLIVFIDPPTERTFRRNINGMRQIARDLTLEQYVATSEQQFEQVGAEVVSEGETTFAGTPAYEWRYRATMASQDLEFWGIVTMRDGRPWGFTYTADVGRFEEALPDVAALFESVRLPD